MPDARSWLTTTLHGWAAGPEARSALDDALVCVSELVTNALRAQCTSLSLSVELLATALHIGVSDDAPGVPAVQHPGATDPHGRGLLIISALSERWGVRPRPKGKQVWADLPWPTGTGTLPPGTS